MKAKVKTKKPYSKFGKVKLPSKEVGPVDPDLSQLRQPIDTSVSTLYRVSKILENGSDEVKSILAYECDLLYECRVCRSLFRSLVNFISHKRTYCKEKFDVTYARHSFNDYDTTFASKSNIQEQEKMLEETCGNDRILRSQVSKEEPKKDLTAIVDMLQKKQTESLETDTNTERVCLETVQSNSSAVYQTVDSIVSIESPRELMKTQVTELKDMISGQTAVLGPNGQVLQPSQELDTNDETPSCNNKATTDVPANELKCCICDASFATKKTLAVHTRTLHTSYRLCYPCPCCVSTFANTWSVYRHLFKVHRKTNYQVRKFRSQIQEKAFIKDTTVAEDLQKEDANKILLNAPLRVNETQEWMDHLESDAELQRCGGCGKRFDRKAALSSHSQHCHRRVAAYESTAKVKKTSQVSPCSGLTDGTVSPTESPKTQPNPPASTEITNSNETPIRVETVASLSKADWDSLGNGGSICPSESNEDVTVITNGVNEDAIKDKPPLPSDASDPLEIVYTSISKEKPKVGSKKRKNKDSAKRLITNTGNNATAPEWSAPLEVQTQAERMDYVLIMEKKVASIVNFQKLKCLPCKRKFTTVTKLRRHAAIHIGWNRYQCKLCDFKCFLKCDCVAHCNKEHNAQNNRVIIEGMTTLIPGDQYTYERNIVLDIINLGEEHQPPEVVEVSVSPESIIPEVRLEEQPVDKAQTEVAATDTVVLEESDPENGGTQESASNDSSGQSILGLDPELRKMVMEVIFGSSEANSAKQAEVKGAKVPGDIISELQSKETSKTRSNNSDLKGSDVVAAQNNPKPQRPIRNKIKPLNKDFIYDLKEVAFRKDSLIGKSFNKSLAKKSLAQAEGSSDEETEQLSKRFKSLQNNGVTILCEKNVMNKCEMKLQRQGLKSNLAFSKCHS